MRIKAIKPTTSVRQRVFTVGPDASGTLLTFIEYQPSSGYSASYQDFPAKARESSKWSRTFARHFGAEVVVIELDDKRRAAVETLGFEVLDPKTVDQVEWVTNWTGGAGADVVFEVSGAASAVLGATGLCKVRGRLVVVAIHPEPRPIDLQRLFWRELTIIGARVYERTDFEKAIEMVAAGVVPTSLLITRIEPLENTAAAFEALGSGQAMKILIDCQPASIDQATAGAQL